ncbi:enoyl-CoA hydratase/isomerase family protein [Streptomyces sp. NPDC003710]
MLKPETFAELANPDAGSDGDESLINPMQKLMLRLRPLPQVTIAKLAGRLRGGADELAMAHDMRFAARGRTWLAQPETRMGIIPGGGGTQLLPPLVGGARALEAILGGNLFDAEVAERYGRINRALPAEELDGFIDSLARRIAALRPEQITAAKAAVGAAATSGSLLEGLGEESKALGGVYRHRMPWSSACEPPWRPALRPARANSIWRRHWTVSPEPYPATASAWSRTSAGPETRRPDPAARTGAAGSGNGHKLKRRIDTALAEKADGQSEQLQEPDHPNAGQQWSRQRTP